MKEYTFVTTYIVLAPDKETAKEVKEKIISQLENDDSVLEYWTLLTDVEDERS